MKQETVTLRCEDGAEAVVFTRYDYRDGDTAYDISVEDSYVGGDYKGFFGRLKRAWRAFKSKPVIYTGIYCGNENKMRNFLFDCLEVIDNPDDLIEETP